MLNSLGMFQQRHDRRHCPKVGLRVRCGYSRLRVTVSMAAIDMTTCSIRSDARAVSRAMDNRCINRPDMSSSRGKNGLARYLSDG